MHTEVNNSKIMVLQSLQILRGRTRDLENVHPL